jgi:outer membrane receptor protein involved in Fe transport
VIIMSSNRDIQRNDSMAQRAANLAMFTGAVAGIQQTTALAQEPAAEELSEIVVTGSRIRRLDSESASPVEVITAASIQESGVANIGELIQRLPAIAGAATNPAVNNGGGDGATNVELRGLGVERTLVLLNGRRYGALSNLSSAVDVNSIPINMIERVEVLKSGAGAIYGSDAIGGVVNFITKTSQDGAEVSVDFGESSEGDGQRKGVSVSWGAQNDISNLVFGMTYNKQDKISAGDRAFSRNAIYLYGSVFEGGSSRTPTGRINLDTASAASLAAAYAPCPADEDNAGAQGITRIEGTSGASLSDYRCFVDAGDPNDLYNYQPLNLILTPQERASVFTLGTHQINEDVELYGEFLYNRTKSGFQIAPLPFNARSDNTLISKDNIYNPFGIDFGTLATDPDTGDLLNPDAAYRLESLGNRRNSVVTWQGTITLGLRGSLFDTGWNWDASGGYSRMDQDRDYDGYLFKSGFANALGPSFIATDGTPTCGTPAAPISGCVPVNIFNLSDPSQIAGLESITAGYSDSYDYWMKTAALGFDGKLYDLPAGAVQAAAGFEYRDQNGSFNTDFLTQSSPPLYNQCLLQQEACSGDQQGSYDVAEFFGEVLVPILRDRPGAVELNLTVGLRYSDYSTFGNTTNGTYKIDWKPVDELLVRGSYADVFRAPTIIDINQAPTADQPVFTDPCTNLTVEALAENPNLALACENVTPDGTFAEPNAQVDALFLGNAFLEDGSLDPEEGDAWTIGFVYAPERVKGLSLSVDYWDYSLDNVITQVDANTTAEACVATGSPQFCGYISRFNDGTIQQILEPTINLGSLDTSGVDFSVVYDLATDGIGDFSFGVDATWTEKYDSTVISGLDVTEVAGTYDRQYGNIAKWRVLGNVSWAYSDFTAQLVTRYIDSVNLRDPDGAPGIQPDLVVPSQTYLDLTASYTLPKTNTRFQLGVNNLTDNQPPILYQNNVINANTDVETYDTIGRYFFGTISQKF